jgi:hypothetical protein
MQAVVSELQEALNHAWFAALQDILVLQLDYHLI